MIKVFEKLQNAYDGSTKYVLKNNKMRFKINGNHRYFFKFVFRDFKMCTAILSTNKYYA